MTLTYSSMLELGSSLKEFNLLDTVSGNSFSSTELDEAKPSLIMFICNHCPYVIHYHDEIKRLAGDYAEILNMVAISSNDIENYPQDGPDKMRELWEDLGLSFPYLFDSTQEIAKKYKAECTPEFYLFDHLQQLVYRGRLDESSPNSGIEPTGEDLRDAIDNLIIGKEINSNQLPSMGCNIKWI
ncbi:thioredoxin family protein [Pseudomonadota bacterium]|nr:thioredoxin family protein [Pseudomonadota bacterium]